MNYKKRVVLSFADVYDYFMAVMAVQNHKNALHWFAATLGFALVLVGLYLASQSSLFELKHVNVMPLSKDYPITDSNVLGLAQIRTGRVSLFRVGLSQVESRLMKDPWVKGVVVEKIFPDTLSLRIIERHPVALLTEASGRVTYFEEDGSSFEDSELKYAGDLPILSGFSQAQLKPAHEFLKNWFSAEKFPGLKISSLNWDEKLGLRAVVSSPQKNKKLLRAVIELGLNIEEAQVAPSDHLKRVLDYLADHNMPASRIWLGDGKKIVVKVLKGT